MGILNVGERWAKTGVAGREGALQGPEFKRTDGERLRQMASGGSLLSGSTGLPTCGLYRSSSFHIRGHPNISW